MTATVIPEQGTYDSTVYQLQITDPVQGYNPSNSNVPANVGVSNQPILNLANRTGWLYNQINNILDGATVPNGLATLLSPQFTGTPTAPTPPLGDNTTKISTTAFVQGSISGLLSLSVAGNTNVALTAAQAGNGILNFTGALTGNIAVIVPQAGKWVVENNTTGAFSLTVKTAAGTGVAVSQGLTNELYCDGTNVYAQRNDFVSLNLTGTPTAPTPAIGDQSTKIATTNFVYNLKNGVVTVPVGGSSNVVLTAAQYGNGILLLTGALTGAIQVILPAQGGYYVVANETTGAYGLTMGCGGAGKTATIPQGQSVIVYCDGTNVVLAGAAASSSFTANTFTATAAQVDFPCSYTPGNILVLRNGAVVSSANYTATDGANVIFASACTAGEEIQVIAFSSFTVSNAVTVAGGTMQGALQLFGGDTGTTAAQFDNSTKLATTAFVQQFGNNYSGVYVPAAGATIPTSYAGALLSLSGAQTTSTSWTLPNPGTLPNGTTFAIYNGSNTPGVSLTLTSAGGSGAGDFFGPTGNNAGATSYVIGQQCQVHVIANGGNWTVIDGAGVASLASSGFQKLPSGLIIQWGTTTGSASGYVAATFPLAFPNACYQVVGTFQSLGLYQTSVNINTLSKTGFNMSAVQAGSYSAQPVCWVAIGA